MVGVGEETSSEWPNQGHRTPYRTGRFTSWKCREYVRAPGTQSTPFSARFRRIREGRYGCHGPQPLAGEQAAWLPGRNSRLIRFGCRAQGHACAIEPPRPRVRKLRRLTERPISLSCLVGGSHDPRIDLWAWADRAARGTPRRGRCPTGVSLARRRAHSALRRRPRASRRLPPRRRDARRWERPVLICRARVSGFLACRRPSDPSGVPFPKP